MNTANLTACPHCDLLIHTSSVVIGIKAYCPRCGFLLFNPRQHSIERTFALAITGLILFLPANVLPLVGIKLLGNHKDGTLWSGVASLYSEGMWGLAIVVFLASMLFPLCKLLLAFCVSGCLFFNIHWSKLNVGMRYLTLMDEWAMLEVYTLGIIVACVKLESMAELRFGFGLYAFAGLLLITGMLSSSLDEHFFWQRINHLRKQSRKNPKPKN